MTISSKAVMACVCYHINNIWAKSRLSVDELTKLATTGLAVNYEGKLAATWSEVKIK